MASRKAPQASVIYRRGNRFGRITAADYDEAIEALREARTQLEPNGHCCHVCHDDGHMAWECNHNPLVVARRSAAMIHIDADFTIVPIVRVIPWRCFHCDRIFFSVREAREHFGKSDKQKPKCLRIAKVEALR